MSDGREVLDRPKFYTYGGGRGESVTEAFDRLKRLQGDLPADTPVYVDSAGTARRDWTPGEDFYDAGIPTDAGDDSDPAPALPASVRVGFKTYEIRPWPAAAVVDDVSLGRCEHYASRIYVAVDGRPAADVAETLIHEVLHAAWHVARLEDAPPEEKAVSTLASVLCQVFRDNPDLMTYLDGVYFSLPGS